MTTKYSKFSFIFPIHNEGAYIVNRMKLFITELRELGITNYRILLVENGSTDKSWQLIKKLTNNTKILGLRISGASYGRAIQHGLLSTNSKYIFIQDADFFSKTFIAKAIPLLKKNFVVVGSKHHRQSKDNRPILDRLRSKLLISLLALMFNYQGTDTNGLKAFNNTKQLKTLIRSCYAKYELFDSELMLRISRLGLSIAELPIDINEIRPSRYIHFQRWLLVIKDLWRLITFHFFKENHLHQINADDFGLSEIVNQAILARYYAGNIDVVSVLPNLVTAQSAELLKNIGKSSLSLHFNLLNGKSTSIQSDVESLVNRNGQFYPVWIFFIKLMLKKININEVELELNKQIQVLNGLNIFPTKIDSEKHLHTFPPISQVVARVAKQNGFKLRHINSTIDYLKPRFPKLQMYYILQKVLGNRYPNTITQSSWYDAQIIHPGSNYD